MKSKMRLHENYFCVICLLLLIMADESKQDSIISFVSPQNNSIVAVGGRIPAINAVLKFPSDWSVVSCKWNNESPFYADTSCLIPTSCSKFNNSAVNTSYIDSNKASSSLAFSVSCDLIQQTTSVTESATSILYIIVQNCSMYLPSEAPVVKPTIKGNNFTYKARGQFDCGSAALFNQDGSVALPETECLNNASWKHESVVECWTVPDVTLDGNFSGQVGNKLEVNCTYDANTYPSSSGYNLEINGAVVKTINVGQPYETVLTRDMNGDTIRCQAVTKYTTKNQTLGWSSTRTLNVTFKPYKGTTTTNCIENQQCDIQVVSNPAPGNPFLVAPAIESFTWTVQNHPYYTFQITKPKGTYMFRVNNSVGEGMFNVTVDAKTPISPSNLALIIGASVAGVLVIAFVIILIVVIRRRNAGKSEQEERQNPIYGSSPNAVDNGTDYAQVQKKNKKNKKEMTENIAYQPASSPDAIEDAYASVSKNEKEVKMNILYGSSTGAHTSQVEDAYAEVDKGKKKKKDKTKAMKVNVAYVPTPENPDAPEEAYAEVNKDKKKKGKKGEREMKDNILYGSSQAGGSVEDAYAEVDKKKKKNAGAKQGEASSGATYSEVSKPKNKKKDKPSSSQTPDDDPYAEVDLHGQDSSNLE